MNAPRTAREALIAEMLGDLDVLLARVETIPALIAGAETQFSGTLAALDDAGDKYRTAVKAFTEQAKADLLNYQDIKRADAAREATKTIDEQRAAIQEAAREAFRIEVKDHAVKLGTVLNDAAKVYRRSMWTRIMEHGITAIIASGFTAVLVYTILQLGAQR
jgi:hypothetical protein